MTKSTQKARDLMKYMDQMFIRMSRLLDRGAPDEDINRNEMKVLHLLSENGPSTMGQIAIQLGLALSSTTTVADKMVEQKLITRYRSEEDRRVVLLGLAPGGSRIFENAQKNRLKFTSALLDQLSTEDQDTLIALHRKITERFSSMTDTELENLYNAGCTSPKKGTVKSKKGTNRKKLTSKLKERET